MRDDRDVTAAEGIGADEVEAAAHRLAYASALVYVGNAHLAFVPPTHRVLANADDLVAALADGHTLPPGDYTVVDESSSPEVTHGPLRVLSVDDHPDPSTYDQELAEGFGYLTTRDGVSLSVMVRFPNEDLYGPAPWPTVIEYSGYGPSNPDAPQPGTILAGLLANQARWVLAAHRAQGLRLERMLPQGPWTTIVVRKAV